MKLLSTFGILISLTFFLNSSLAQSPPYPRLTISGKTLKTYNRVSLFEDGSATVPLRTEYVSEYDGQYYIDIYLPNDMQKKDKYYYTDMRFWADLNGNRKRDPDEPRSECHFIIWYPDLNRVFLQVYEGPRFEILSDSHNYDYKN